MNALKQSVIYINKWSVPALVVALFLVLGAYFAGWNFLANISTAVPRTAAGGEAGLQYMLPGDHFEQLYRYSLPRHNLENGMPLYESGYQYNFSSDSPAFYEGLIFFPFSALHTVLSYLTGDVAAYNLLALLSFPLVGGAMYWLVFFLTRSHPAALLSALILALLPHRTSFLFGEMLYGMDLMWPPLIVLMFEKAIRSLQVRYAFLFGVALFFYATSNFQGLYLFSVFSLPYFLIRVFQVVKNGGFDTRKLWRQASFMALALLPSLIYLFTIRGLIAASGLSGGQDYAETTFYSPTLLNAISVWSGNEKTIYLGWPFFVTLALLIYFGIAGYYRKTIEIFEVGDRSVLWLAGLCFVVSYLFCLGPHLDTILNVNVYRWYFDHFPGASGTRTPGRLMNAAGFWFALFFGMFVHLTLSGWEKHRVLKRLIFPVVIIGAVAIVYNYHYTRPLLIKLESHNFAYEKIRGTPGIVYTVPTQVQAPHFLNATFLFYTHKYNLKIFGGHSSIYPKEWDKIIGDFLPINDGRFDRKMMERFKLRGITHLAVHATSFEPNVPPIVLARLKQSPYLQLLAEDKGVNIFEVDYSATGEQTIEPSRLLSTVQLRSEDYGKFMYFDGWYGREVYPDQRPFRWMQGAESSGVVFAGTKGLTTAEFAFRCPLESLNVMVNGRKVTNESADLGEGWRKLVIDLPAYGQDHYLLQFHTSKTFKAPPDTREFGCMIGDIVIR